MGVFKTLLLYFKQVKLRLTKISRRKKAMGFENVFEQVLKLVLKLDLKLVLKLVFKLVGTWFNKDQPA